MAGLWLRELRKRHRLSQAQLAYRAGTSQQALSRIERGLVSPTVELLARLAAACGEELVLAWRERGVPFEDAQLDERTRLPISNRLALSIPRDWVDGRTGRLKRRWAVGGRGGEARPPDATK